MLASPLIRIALFLALSALTLSAQAQRQAPSEAELRAAYCVSALTGRSTEAQIRLALPGSKARKEAWREAQAVYERDARRHRGFLVPRMKLLDGAPLLAAADRGQADAKAVAQAEQACEAACDGQGANCLSACAPRGAAAERVSGCSESASN